MIIISKLPTKSSLTFLRNWGQRLWTRSSDGSWAPWKNRTSGETTTTREGVPKSPTRLFFGVTKDTDLNTQQDLITPVLVRGQKDPRHWWVDNPSGTDWRGTPGPDRRKRGLTTLNLGLKRKVWLREVSLGLGTRRVCHQDHQEVSGKRQSCLDGVKKSKKFFSENEIFIIFSYLPFLVDTLGWKKFVKLIFWGGSWRLY